MPKLTIRDFTPDDFAEQDAYFNDASDDYLLRLGVDPQLIRERPARDLDSARQLLKVPVAKRAVHSFVFELDGRSSGIMTLKPIIHGESCGAHGHIYDSDLRQISLGTQGLVIGFDRAFKIFDLKMIFCEPSVGNPAPNALLQKLGLKIVATYETPPSGILVARQANRYEIERDWFYKILRPRFL